MADSPTGGNEWLIKLRQWSKWRQSNSEILITSNNSNIVYNDADSDIALKIPVVEASDRSPSKILHKVSQPSAKTGYLMKKSPSLFKSYQKRYFVLMCPGEMSYFNSVSFTMIILT
jgi:hypothetical protein